MGMNSRRAFLKNSLIATGMLAISRALFSATPPAAPLPPRPTKNLDLNDPVAKALGYVEDHTKADATKFPQLKTLEGKKQTCKNCQLYNKPINGRGQCTIFANGLVPDNGWCVSWSKKV